MALLLTVFVSTGCSDGSGQASEVAVIETTIGRIEIGFFPEVAPLAVANFKGLAQRGYYDGVIFHRVIKDFMIQGGDPTGTGAGGESLWGEPFADEYSEDLRFDRPGLVGMANRGPNTNGSQFFITLVPTPWLNDRHTIFGAVIAGMDVVNAIGDVETGPRDRPVVPVVMETVRIERQRPFGWGGMWRLTAATTARAQ